MIIYKVTNKFNGKVYIGQTIKPLNYRWSQHCSYTSNCVALNRAIKKYGKENFTVEQIDIANSQDELDDKERYWIEFYQSFGEKGYNLTNGGEINKLVSEETKLKISLANKGNKYCVGRVMSDETKQKIGEKARLRLSDKTKHPRYGIKVSDEYKFKQRISHLGQEAPNRRKVRCVETDEVFESIKLAAQKIGLKPSNVGDCCRGRQKTAGGYHWEYFETVNRGVEE